MPVTLQSDNTSVPVFTWDNHACICSTPGTHWIEDLTIYHEAGIDCVSINIGDARLPLDRVIRLLAEFRDWIQRSDSFALVNVVDDIERANAADKTAVVFDLEGVYALQGQLNVLPLLYDMGLRWASIAYNRGNWAGGGCHDSSDPGLSTAGTDLVHLMEELGLLVCCSHTGYQTSLDVLSMASQPVLFSHSNARALVDHPRNVTDEQIKLSAATGGCVGICGVSLFLGAKGGAERVIEHIDHMVQLVGSRHVSIALDYELNHSELSDDFEASRDLWPSDQGYGGDLNFLRPDAFSAVAEGLLHRGYPIDAIQDILGGNLKRIARQVWR